jgi:hypothetical protein
MKSGNLSILIKRLVRKSVSARNNCPIKIVDGCDPPKLKGRGWYYTNKRGDEIHYPVAYRKAWGKPIYNHSTIRVEVGGDWLLNSLTEENVRMLRLKMFT